MDDDDDEFPDVDEVIRQRLLTRTTIVGKSMMKRTADCLFSFLDSTGHLDRYNDEFAGSATKKPKQTLSRKRAQDEMDTFLWELEMLQVDARRTELLVFTCERELEAYEALHKDIDRSIVSVTKDIDRLKGVVANEKIIRQYKEEYEVAARAINQFASPKKSADVVEGLEDQLRASTEALQAITDRVELKSKELALLMRAIRDLQSNYRDDEDDVVVVADDEEARVKDDEADDYESKHTEEPVATVADHTPDQEEEPVEN
ncbi:hypothetical protein LEN26_007591 [Aphanomyces euteiches]|nr:hypothetical protein AeMF1_013275 [Aphanomyces euteiches]KAH9131756.1 hypothetical protein LEN26_007591 [Aphanomyces euteiches]KAH9186804.1 hypothetical protein AeNC1_011223 [Aphanomyces euteiches]